ncbi:DUF1540 domain-containing protein [Bacillota bacterium LX-D]|nr:DUF1540 domain-containing protein [Bacillota bacterium LX-D]
MQHIHCSISNCHYWEEGNKCQAQEILVTSDLVADAMPSNYDAHQAGLQMDSTPVDDITKTCCKTFVEKGSNETKADDIKRQ